MTCHNRNIYNDLVLPTESASHFSTGNRIPTSVTSGNELEPKEGR